MMRRWADSAARARAWARPARAHSELRGTGLRFDLLRHGRAPLTVQLLLHAHHHVAIAVHVHLPRTVARRAPNVHERASMSSHVLVRRATLRTAVRERLVESRRSRPAAATLAPASPTAHPSRDTFVLRTHTGLVSRWLHHQVERRRTERVTAHATIRNIGTPGVRERATYLHEYSRLALQPAYAPEFPARVPAAARARAAAPHRERWLHLRRTIRSDRLLNLRVRTPALRDVRPAARAAAGPDKPNAPMHLPPASRRASAPAVPRAAHTFAPSPQPLPGAARAAAPTPPPVERIERSLRESMTKMMQHTVRHEVERVLRPDTQLSRRLRESVQAEMYDDIVFERERLGER